jgi:hypothetical protein
MSRIRSVHPGFFTDEDLVSVSMGARLMFIGLGVEADDKGVFEWKPLTIKMRLFPADNVVVEELLAELSVAGAIRQFENGGKKYGAIRNFRKFQKPKTPNNIHPAGPEILAFVGLSDAPVPEPIPPNGETFPPKGEIAPQMEEGGEDGEEEESAPNGACASGDARFTASDFVESWNETADLCGLPRIAKLTDRRKRAFAVRQREYPDIDDWRRAFRCLRDSPWMHGDNKTGWRADPDFFLQPKSFTKLVEGSYGKAN